MTQISLNINGKEHVLDTDLSTPLLWVIRDLIGLKGTKFGCGIAQCGACTVHMDGNAVRSCVLPVAALSGKKITTIEGISKNNDHPIQKAWNAEQVPQCGYCQSGQIMSAVALLNRTPKPSERDIEVAMQGNICRCGTYNRVKKAIQTAAKTQGDGTH